MHLGGLSIDCNAHFVGHSDADVLLHAITDALLSAANLPDIGQLFPNNLEENRGRDSAEMLSLAMDQVRETGWELVNLDCVVQLERPKLSPIKKELIERISSVLRTDFHRVSLKGKTGEGTGAIGRGELAEAHCVALITKSPPQPVEIAPMDAPQDPAKFASDERQLWIQQYRSVLMEIAKQNIDPVLRSKVDASDVIQETMTSAANNIAEAPTSIHEFQRYLRLILINKLTDIRRKFARSKKRDISRETTRDELSSDELKQIASQDDSPLENLISEELLERTRRAMQELPNEIKEILKWRYEEEKTFVEIGKRLNRTEDDVRMLVNRCIARLRRKVHDSE
jgi:2-C-methyl-D-erythritol 2,4-cyclodiphosphate synthase